VVLWYNLTIISKGDGLQNGKSKTDQPKSSKSREQGAPKIRRKRGPKEVGRMRSISGTTRQANRLKHGGASF